MKKIEEKCEICGSEIDEYSFYVSEDRKYYCSNECVEKELDNEEFNKDVWDIQFCPAYDYCKQLNNTRKKCIFKNNITEEKSPVDKVMPGNTSPNWCHAAEASQIISNVKLFNFVKKSEESSAQLNEESFNQNKTTKNLTYVMTGVSIVNLILIVVQICLQVTG